MHITDFLSEWNSPEPCILLHTSGSTGCPKPLWVEKSRMRASAQITCDYLQLQPGNTALLCLPLQYIAGKMVVVRALERQLRLISVAPSNHPLRDLDDAIDFAAMVPSQVYSSLHHPIERQRLSRIKNLLIGGGAISEDLNQELQDMCAETNNECPRIFSTYGMTETLSHIALRSLTGPNASSWYEPLEGVNLSLDDNQCLIIDAPVVHEGKLLTHDIAEFHPDGRRFRILGRTDNIICSGGLKFQIEQIEEALRPHLTLDFCITSRPDSQYGEVIVLLLVIPYPYPTSNTPHQMPHNPRQTALIRQHLHFLGGPFSYIKEIIPISSVPLTPSGKINRPAAQSLISSLA